MSGKSKYRYCTQNCQGIKEIQHNLVGVLRGEDTPFGKMADQLQWQCTSCNHVALESIPKRRCHKRTWPYYNESVGETFVSESHEQAYVKKNNLTPA